MRDRHHKRALGWMTVAAAALLQVGEPPAAEACGCLSPPAPTPLSSEAYAVNQRAEQIIFEVEPGWVTAHVLIKYAGAPEKFAWLIPVPELPELAISPVSAFGILDQLTAPDVGVDVRDICPVSAWQCNYHAQQSCTNGFGGVDDGVPLLDAGSFGDAPGGQPSGIDILDQKVVGDYETVTFRATEAALASQWLNDNGFIVNATTTIYMESYVQQNMVFVAAKLVAGAGISAIKPLRLKYRAPYPMVPLVLTAVAAEPHLTVSAFVFGNLPFKPMGHPVVSIDAGRIAQDGSGRANYPMVLARTIDEAGGDGFAIEYRGSPLRPNFGQQSGCCGGGFDSCFLGGNGQCECPRDEFDRADCEALGDIVEGVALVDDLASRYSAVTRLTTRVSPEEMTFDPTFEPDFTSPLGGRLVARGSQASLAGCRAAVMDRAAFAVVDATQACAATYCGPGSQCVTTTASGAACVCEAGRVAQMFVDLDGKPSVTCVPRVPPVDLGAGGLQLPDACRNVSCGLGQCIDRNGVPACQCDAGAAAAPGPTGKTPVCTPIVLETASPGAEDFSAGLEALQVCAPPPPSCGSGGWLTQHASPRPGVDCGNAQPEPLLTIEPPEIKCEGFWGCGCQGGGDPFGGLAIGGAVVALLVGKRRRRPEARG
ncbi:MAG: DUF2330 domain-containing protein [Deltaproteobacteria bacterium]|nr:DUF2330 domain-containing protein [Deltaproteobacteria bacterium]